MGTELQGCCSFPLPGHCGAGNAPGSTRQRQESLSQEIPALGMQCGSVGNGFIAKMPLVFCDTTLKSRGSFPSHPCHVKLQGQTPPFSLLHLSVRVKNPIKTEARSTFVVKVILLPKFPLIISLLDFKEHLIPPQLKCRNPQQWIFLDTLCLGGLQSSWLQPGGSECTEVKLLLSSALTQDNSSVRSPNSRGFSGIQSRLDKMKNFSI